MPRPGAARRALGALAIAGLAVIGAIERAAADPPPLPGIVMLDPEARRDALAQWDEAARSAACKTLEPRRYEALAPEIAIAPGRGGQAGEALAMQAMSAGAKALAGPANDADEAAIAQTLANLEAWAAADALSVLEDTRSTAYYNLDRTFFPLLVNWAILRDWPGLDHERRAAIDAWLDDVQAMRGPEGRTRTGEANTDRNNHRYLADSATMAWGALRGDEAAFAVGVERYRAAMAQLTENGAFPLEIGRGGRALFYQRHAISSLVAIAEIAAARGIDLYGPPDADGPTIHRAIRFLVEASNDQRLLLPFFENDPASARRVAWGQDMGFMRLRGHGRHYMAWVEPYLRRFEGSAVGCALADLLARRLVARPLVDDYAGGATSCFFARQAPLAARAEIDRCR